VSRSDCRPDVADRVPCLLDDQNAGAVIANADVNRARRVVRSRRQLEGRWPADRTGEPEKILLDLQVCGISGLSLLAERSREGHHKRLPEGDP